MRIGISSPITIAALRDYLDAESQVRAEHIPGLLAPAVDAVAVEFLKAGHEVVVVTLDQTITSPIVLKGPRLTVYVGIYRKRARARALTFFWLEIKYLRSCIRQERLDVLHAHWTYEFAIAALAASCPVVCTVRDVAETIFAISRNTYRYIRLWMNRYVFWRGKRIHFVANSPYTASLLKKHHPNADFTVIPNSVSPAFLAWGARKRQGRVFVSINNGWSTRKNIDVLIRAFNKVRNRFSDAQLWLVGGDFAEGCSGQQRLCTENPDLLAGVCFKGRVSHEDLPLLFKKVDVLVHPALEESFGNTLIEAMASGIPVVGGARSGAVPWVLGEGKFGVLCDVASVDDLADAMASLLCDDAAYDRMARAGWTHVQERFRAQSIAAQTIAYYEEVISS